jgi:hypothetical protein
MAGKAITLAAADEARKKSRREGSVWEWVEFMGWETEQLAVKSRFGFCVVLSSDTFVT